MSNKWNILDKSELQEMRKKIRVMIKDDNKTWVKLGELTNLDQSNLKISIERAAALLNKFSNLMGQEVVFRKKEPDNL